MALPKSWTKITPFSKTLALSLFILLPIAGFYFGIYFEQQTRQGFPNFACKQWETVCDPDYANPDGTCATKRICVNPSLKPTIAPEPTIPSSIDSRESFCGGIAGKQCSAGFTCKLDGDYPDAGGTCVKEGATKPKENEVMCTMEAKQCPDGSWVGRSGPKCEFAACPAAHYLQ